MVAYSRKQWAWITERKRITSRKEDKPVGFWAQRHLRYIKQNKKNLFFDLYVSKRMNGYLSEIETQAQNMFSRLVKEMSSWEGVIEVLKAKNQFIGVQRSNIFHNRAKENVNSELIYA